MTSAAPVPPPSSGPPKSSEPVRAVLVGTGSIARAHVEAVAANAERVELVAAADIDPARAEAFCERNGIPRGYGDVEAMLAAERPAIVHICTPPGSHLPLVLRALEAGAWVLCEKPLCGSLADLDAIEAAERRSGAYCSSVFQIRFGAAGQHVKRLIESGELGRPLVALCQTAWYRGDAYYAVPWHGQWAEAFGGPTMQLGIHTMDLFLWLWPDWDEVTAAAATLNHQMEVEDVSLATVRFAGGALASVINSAVSPGQETALRLDHERATVAAHYLYRYGNEDWRIDAPENAPWAADAERWRAIPTPDRASHGAQLRQLLDCMAAGERPLGSGPEVRRTLEFVSCLYKSAFTHQPIRRGSLTPDDPYYRSVNGHAPVAS
jgi:predicted dehydrogenase